MKLTAEIARQLLDYDPETGELTWKPRDRSWFKSDAICKMWNTRFSNKEAFTYVLGGYKKGYIFGKAYYAHRVIFLFMTGKWPDQTDHINGIRSDNRWENLRSVDLSGNRKNARKPKHNKSGRIGVHLQKATGNWCAQIDANGEKMHLGTFKSFEAACEMRAVAERNYLFHPNHGRSGPKAIKAME